MLLFISINVTQTCLTSISSTLELYTFISHQDSIIENTKLIPIQIRIGFEKRKIGERKYISMNNKGKHFI